LIAIRWSLEAGGLNCSARDFEDMTEPRIVAKSTIDLDRRHRPEMTSPPYALSESGSTSPNPRVAASSSSPVAGSRAYSNETARLPFGQDS